jgi:hypothetical protein
LLYYKKLSRKQVERSMRRFIPQATKPDKRPWPLFWLALFVTSQLLLPALLLLGPRPVRFGWQMYADSSLPPSFTLRLRDGEEHVLPLESTVVRVRGDMWISAEAVARLCLVYPEAVAIRYTQYRLPAQEVLCR